MSSANTYFDDGVASTTNTVTVSEIHYGRDYPSSMFWPTFQPGVEVNDLVGKSFTKVPGPATTPATKKSSADAPLTVAAPAKPPTTEVPVVVAPAVPPLSWSSVGSSASLGLGLVLVVAGVVAGWRRAR